ncbi:DUF6907 domain-containing protein [Streptomyces sp. NPDC101455]|uniref:DUF6907 domain-containing protein n=1 Tax=Streptomyces sp. NPDC101455 TaxID=3366142 RepID=UPI0038084506
MSAPEMAVARACPPWCTENHAEQAPGDRDYHAGPARELRLPDGRVVMDATLVHEYGESLPQLAVSVGALTALLDEVALLDDEQAARLESALVALAQHVRHGRRSIEAARIAGGAGG